MQFASEVSQYLQGLLPDSRLRVMNSDWSSDDDDDDVQDNPDATLEPPRGQTGISKSPSTAQEPLRLPTTWEAELKWRAAHYTRNTVCDYSMPLNKKDRRIFVLRDVRKSHRDVSTLLLENTSLMMPRWINIILGKFATLEVISLKGLGCCVPDVLPAVYACNPQSLSLRGCHVWQNGLVDMCGCGGGWGNLQQLDVSDISFGRGLADGLHLLADFAALVTFLNISNTGQDETTVLELVAALEQFRKLTKLYVANNHIGVVGVSALMASTMAPRLKKLDISNTGWDGTGVSALATLCHGTLRVLKVSGNPLSVQAVMELLRAGADDRQLFLGGVSAAAEALSQVTVLAATTLSVLDLRDVQLSPPLAEQLLRSLSSTVSSLCLVNTGLTETVAPELARKIHNLRELHISFNNIGPRAMAILAEAAPYDLSKLQYFHSVCTGLDSSAMPSIMLFLSKCFHLHTCMLFGNGFSEAEDEMLQRASVIMASRPTLIGRLPDVEDDTYTVAGAMAFLLVWDIETQEHASFLGLDRCQREPTPPPSTIRVSDVTNAASMYLQFAQTLNGHIAKARRAAVVEHSSAKTRLQKQLEDVDREHRTLMREFATLEKHGPWETLFGELQQYATVLERVESAGWSQAYDLMLETAGAGDSTTLARISTLLNLTETICVSSPDVSLLRLPEEQMGASAGLEKFGNRRRLTILCQSVRNGTPVVRRTGIWSWSAPQTLDWIREYGDPVLMADENITGDVLVTMTRAELDKYGLGGIHPLIERVMCAEIGTTRQPMHPPDYPPEFCCPITHDLLVDPVLASDGHTYERSALAQHMRRSRISPMTRVPLNMEVAPNIAMRNIVEQYRAGLAAKRKAYEDANPPAKRTAGNDPGW